MSREHVLYTILAKYYDVIYRDYLVSIVPKMIDFVEEIFKRHAKIPIRRILDLACGTGGPTIELAKRGYLVVGVDLYKEVLDIAREKALKNNVKIEFIQADVRSIDFHEEFDAATMFFSSISYMTTFEDLEKLLKNVYNALRKGGVFVADAGNPLFLAYYLGRTGSPIVWDVEHGDEKIVMIDYKELENVTGILYFKRLIMIIKPNGTVRVYHMNDKLRLYTAHEFKTVCYKVGFEEVIIYGDMKITEEEPKNARRLFLVAIK